MTTQVFVRTILRHKIQLTDTQWLILQDILNSCGVLWFWDTRHVQRELPRWGYIGFDLFKDRPVMGYFDTLAGYNKCYFPEMLFSQFISLAKSVKKFRKILTKWEYINQTDRNTQCNIYHNFNESIVGIIYNGSEFNLTPNVKERVGGTTAGEIRSIVRTKYPEVQFHTIYLEDNGEK